MWKLLTIMVILILVIILMSWINRFTIIRIEGESMSPTFRGGQLRIVDRLISPKYVMNFGKKVQLGAILVYYSPTGVPVIKRLVNKAQVSEIETLYWFEGDNKENSEDSRRYGFVSQERIYGEVINFRTFLKRTFTRCESDILKGGEHYD